MVAAWLTLTRTFVTLHAVGTCSRRAYSTPAAGSWLLAAVVPGSSVHAIRPWSAAVHTPVHFPEVRSQTPGGA